MTTTTTMGSGSGTHDAHCWICGGRVERIFPFGKSPWIEACVGCGTQSIRPQPSPEELDAFYRDYPTTNTSQEELDHLIHASHATLAYYAKQSAFGSFVGRSYLEVGFGNGAGLFAAADAGMKVHGADLDESNVLRARLRAAERRTPINVEVGGAGSLTTGEEMFDLVRASQVIEHTLDPLAFVRSLAAVQRTGGIVAIDCPNNRAAFWRVKNALRRRFGREDFYNALRLREHLWGFTREGLGKVLERAGYEVLSLADYALQDRVVQPQAAFWYPPMRSAVSSALRTKNIFPVLKSSIGVFDLLASRVASAGMGLVAIARRR